MNLQSKRLSLRAASKMDLDQLHAVFSDPRAMRYWSTPPHSSKKDTATFIDGMIATSFDEGQEFVAVFNGKFIGKAGYWRFPEIGFIFHPDYWGQGLAHEAIASVVEYGFRVRELREITADVDPRNSRSIKLLERLGFQETGRGTNTIKVGNEWCDSVYYALMNKGT